MKRGSWWAAAVLVVLVFPSWALANAGTPLMWGSCFHLVFGNALIGLGEGWLLAWWFGAPRRRCIWGMIAANYFSAWTGILLLQKGWVESLPVDITNVWWWMWILVASMYVFTVVLEWPFVAWCLRGSRKKKWRGRSLWASGVLQTVSYLGLILFYGSVNVRPSYRQVRVVPAAELALPASVQVYYIAAEDGNVYLQTLAGGNRQLVYALHSPGPYERLLVRPGSTQPDCWDLVGYLQGADPTHPRLVVIKPDLAIEAAPDAYISEHPPQYRDSRYIQGAVPQLDAAGHIQWEVFTYSYALEGLQAHHKTTDTWVAFAHETFFFNWPVCNAVQLPGDKVLFQLGDHQICVFDLATRRIALLWHGRGPVAFIDKSGAQASATQASTTPGGTTPPSATQAGTVPSGD